MQHYLPKRKVDWENISLLNLVQRLAETISINLYSQQYYCSSVLTYVQSVHKAIIDAEQAVLVGVGTASNLLLLRT